MSARNKVIKGEYLDKTLTIVSNGLKIEGTDVVINSDSISYYTEISTEVDRGSAAKRGILGGVLLGPIGIVGGALLNKKIVTLKIEFKDGKKSIIEIDYPTYQKVKVQLETL